MSERPPTVRRMSPGRTTLVRAATLTMIITISGSVLGLGRDLLLARFFGASGGTDAFLVSWTVPETAFPLVVEGALAFFLVPLFSRALSESRPARDVVAATMPRIVAVLLAVTVCVAVAAPLLVRAIAPGLADPALAVTCTRLTSVTVLTFGLAGYLSAALRAHHVFGPPASIHVAYNVGIIALIWALHQRLGIVSAAAGVALGSAFMVLVQLPAFLRHIGLPHRLVRTKSLITVAAFAPMAVYTLTGQAQVFVERFLGSALPPGTISHLNYAQKVGQLPMLVALLVVTVTFPALARGVAAGDAEGVRRRLDTDLRTVTALIVVGAAYLVVFAPVITGVLFERGLFDAEDTSATASILRVYAFGLLGHVLVGALSRAYFTGDRPAWYPAFAMAVGLAVTTGIAAAAMPYFGARAIAAANAIGITSAALLLLLGLRRGIVAVSLAALGLAVTRLGAAAAGAGATGWLAMQAVPGLPRFAVGVGGGFVVLAAFLAMAHLTGSREVTVLTSHLIRRVRRGN